MFIIISTPFLCNMTNNSHISVFAPKRGFTIQLTHKFLIKMNSVYTFVWIQSTDNSLGKMWRLANQKLSYLLFYSFVVNN